MGWAALVGDLRVSKPAGLLTTDPHKNVRLIARDASDQRHRELPSGKKPDRAQLVTCLMGPSKFNLRRDIGSFGGEKRSRALSQCREYRPYAVRLVGGRSYTLLIFRYISRVEEAMIYVWDWEK
jgi:hypothetical protein